MGRARRRRGSWTTWRWSSTATGTCAWRSAARRAAPPPQRDELRAHRAAPGGGRFPESVRASAGLPDGPTGLGRGVPGEPGPVRGLLQGDGEGRGRPDRLGGGDRGPGPVRSGAPSGDGRNDLRGAPPLLPLLPGPRPGGIRPRPGGAATRRGRGSGVRARVGPALAAARGEPRVRVRSGRHLHRAGPGVRPERRPPRPVEPEGARGPGVRAARQGRDRRRSRRDRERTRPQPGDLRLPRR